MMYADLAESGAWPESGGVLDQVQSFVVAQRFITIERQHWKNHGS